MHDTIQLRRACLADEDISRYFRGLFGANELDVNGLVKDTQSTWVIILNTDPLSNPGQHRVAVVKRPEREHCLFFDSYGHRPVDYHSMSWSSLRWFRHNGKDYQQDFSTVCGDYCLFFKKLFSRPERLTKLDFSVLGKYLDEGDDEANDQFVRDTVHAWYPKILNNERHEYLLSSKPQKIGSNSNLYGGLTDFFSSYKSTL